MSDPTPMAQTPLQPGDAAPRFEPPFVVRAVATAGLQDELNRLALCGCDIRQVFQESYVEAPNPALGDALYGYVIVAVRMPPRPVPQDRPDERLVQPATAMPRVVKE